MTSEGPYIVSELLWAAINDPMSLPTPVVELQIAGRLEFRPASLLFTTLSGVHYVLSGKDLLLFRDGAPYTLAHLN